MRSVPTRLAPRPTRLGLSLRAVACLLLAFLLAGVIAPRLVNAHDTLQLVLALLLYVAAVVVLGWGGYGLYAGLRRRRPPRLDVIP